MGLLFVLFVVMLLFLFVCFCFCFFFVFGGFLGTFVLFLLCVFVCVFLCVFFWGVLLYFSHKCISLLVKIENTVPQYILA